MKVEIKKHLLQEGVVDHMKRNWKKYAGGTAAGLGGVYAAGQGVFGVDAQDAVQDFGEEKAHHLENMADKNTIQGYKDAAWETYTKPDNIFGNEGEADRTLMQQNLVQKEHWAAAAQDGLAKGIRAVTGMDEEPDKSNYILRHPINYMGLKADEVSSNVKPLFTRIH